MEKPVNGQVDAQGKLADPIQRFAAAAESLSLAIDREIRQAGSVDIIALSGESRMLRLGFRTLIELLARNGKLELTEWDKAYTAAIERETERIRSQGVKLAVVDAIGRGQ